VDHAITEGLDEGRLAGTLATMEELVRRLDADA
jgi:hypothetical protein